MPSRIAWQLRIGIQGDDVANLRQNARLAHHNQKAIRCASKSGIEVCQLTPFSLVPHPAIFARVPASIAMEQIEDIIPYMSVFGIQSMNALLHQIQSFAIARRNVRSRIDPIGHQCEMKARFIVIQKTQLEASEQPFDPRSARKHRRDHDHGSMIGRNS